MMKNEQNLNKNPGQRMQAKSTKKCSQSTDTGRK